MTSTASASSAKRPAQARSTRRRLAQLGGGEARLLDRVPQAEGPFALLALVMAATAIMAGISMFFALTSAVQIDPPVAVWPSLAWAMLIFLLDRFLTSTMKSSLTWGPLFLAALPRVFMAALIGLVVSTPLVLQIFQDDISNAVQQSNLAQRTVNAGRLAQSDVQKRVSTAEKRVEELNKLIRGEVTQSATGSPATEALKAQVSKLEQDLKSDSLRETKYGLLAQCELTGNKSGLRPEWQGECSGNPGKGDPYPAYLANHEEAHKSVVAITRRLDAARQQLDAAETADKDQGTQTTADARKRASADLPAAVQELNDARSALQRTEAGLDAATQRNVGMLAQLRGLADASEGDPLLSTAHWAIAALFFMVELLPVLTKVLTAHGPPSAYETLSRLEDEQLVRRARTDFDQDRWIFEERLKREREVHQDRLNREKALGLKSNEYVAGKMEKVLQASLDEWGQRVMATLKAQAGAPSMNGSVPANNAAPPAGPIKASGANGAPAMTSATGTGAMTP